MTGAPFVGIYNSVVGFEVASTPADSFGINIQFNPANGPQNALIYVFMHGQGSTPVSSRLEVTFAGGNYKLVSRKYKEELSATIEVWQGWGFMSEEGGGVSPITATFDNTTSAAGIFVVGFTGVELGDQWVSPPAWRFTSSFEQTIQVKTPDPPTTSRPANDLNGTIGRVAQNVLCVARGNTAPHMNAATVMGTGPFGSYDATVLGSGTLDLIPESYSGYIEGSHSSTAALFVGLSLYSPKFLDAKEGTPPESEDTPEDEMRYKERIAQLERDLAETRRTHADAETDFVATNRALTAERDGLKTSLDGVQAAATQHIAQLQAELEATRAELQQTIEAVPQIIAQTQEQYFQQRLNELLADPMALRQMLMEHAQQSQDPRNLFATLQAMNSL